VVIWGKPKPHKVQALAEAMEEVEAVAIPLPTSSADLAPI